MRRWGRGGGWGRRSRGEALDRVAGGPGVTADERDPFGDGLGDEQVVERVVMTLDAREGLQGFEMGWFDGQKPHAGLRRGDGGMDLRDVRVQFAEPHLEGDLQSETALTKTVSASSIWLRMAVESFGEPVRDQRSTWVSSSRLKRAPE